MIVFRHPDQLTVSLVSQTTTLIVKLLADSLQQHFQGMSAPDAFDPEEHGYIVMVEAGDAVKTIETETGCPLLTDWFQESRYGDDSFAPACEWLEDRLLCYEMCFILNDSGYAMLLVIPKLSGIDAQLLAMCHDYALPKVE